jgi:iron complex outermembrane receptor protein
MRILYSFLFLLLCTIAAHAQNFTLTGRILDKATSEGLPGVTVQLSGPSSIGAATDIEGNFKLQNIPAGEYDLRVAFVGYQPITRKLSISKDTRLNFDLEEETAVLNEVEIVADVAVERETPVAFSAVKAAQIQESLAGRDLPMILNETPGVYANNQGGGTGDSEISIRGFSQNNVAVMVNGVPVNDMENGSVFWSNWDLGDVTSNMQVQRGLSASKLSQPSVGGTLNVITKGFDAKKGGRFRQEIGTAGYRKTSLMLSSGELKGGWGVTVYGSRRVANGWVDQAFDDAWTYFGTISKRMGNHKISLTGLGSPQTHGQRSTASLVSMYSHEKANEIGSSVVPGSIERGFAYNPDWGWLQRKRLVNGNIVTGAREQVNTRVNTYHKPQINLNHFWNVSEKINVSNVLYASFGNGGGVSPTQDLPLDNSATGDGQRNLQTTYDANFNADRDTVGEARSTNYISTQVNSHRWLGFISSVDYKPTDAIELTIGIDGRTYTGYHYREVTDLLGGDYVYDFNFASNPNAVNGLGEYLLTTENSTRGDYNVNYYQSNRKLKVGDKVDYNYDGYTRWLGGFAQAEYKTNLYSAFISGSVGSSSYKRVDYFRPKTVTLQTAAGADTSFIVPYGRDVVVNGTTYNNSSKEAKLVETPFYNIPGFTIKGGLNYNLTEHNNIFMNIGYISRAPFFNNYFNRTTGQRYEGVQNEKAFSKEIGYGIKRSDYAITLNAYHTTYLDKTVQFAPSDNPLVSYYVPNMNARHMGIELAAAQKLAHNLDLNAAISVGDWIWTSSGTVFVDRIDKPGTKLETNFYSKGVHVGDAAQNQFMVGLRYEPIKKLYFRASALYFSKYYVNINPQDLPATSNPTDLYRIPSFYNLDLHSGYSFPLAKGVYGQLNGSVTNVLNQFYITDVQRASGAAGFSPSQINVFFNRGRMFTLGLAVNF